MKVLDVEFDYPTPLLRVVGQGLTNLEPWHIMGRELAAARLAGLRARYKPKYVPFARRQDNDDLACFDPSRPASVVVVHDFAEAGYEQRRVYADFWGWFRGAVEDMIEFE